MKYLNRTLAIFSLLTAFFLTSCSDTPEQLNYIPENAAMVMTVDIQEMAVKSKGGYGLKLLFGEETELEKEFKDSGIEVTQKGYLFLNVADNKNDSYVSMVFQLSDPEKFKKYISEKSGSEVKASGEISYLSQDEAMVSWKGNQAILVASQLSDEEKLKTIETLHSADGSASLAKKDEKFSELQDGDFDIALWTDLEKIRALNSEAQIVTEILDVSSSYLTSQITFKDGEVVADSKYYIQKKFAGLLSEEGISDKLVSSLPGEKVLAGLAFSFDLSAAVKLLEQTHMDQTVNKSLSEFGLSLKDIPAILNGNMVAVLNDFSKTESVYEYEGEEYTDKKDVYDASLIIGLKDKAKLDSIVNQYVEIGIITRTGNKITSPQSKDMAMFLEDDYLLITGMQQNIDAYDNGNTGNLPSKDLLSSGSSTFLLDFTSVTEESLMDMGGPKVVEFYKKINLEKFTSNSIVESETEVSNKTVLEFKNKEENALVTISRMVQEAENM